MAQPLRAGTAMVVEGIICAVDGSVVLRTSVTCEGDDAAGTLLADTLLSMGGNELLGR
jgi:hypothetical protein